MCSPVWDGSPPPRSPAAWLRSRRPTGARSHAKPKNTADSQHMPPRQSPQGPVRGRAEIWHIDSTPAPFDIIASASLSLKVSASHHGYNGRSHSLWYADAQTEAETVSSFSAAAPA